MTKSLIKVAIAALLLLVIGSQLIGPKPEPGGTPREFIVEVETGIDREQLSQLFQGHGQVIKPLRSLRPNLHVISVRDPASDTEIIAKLMRLPGILTVEPNSEVRAQ